MKMLFVQFVIIPFIFLDLKLLQLMNNKYIAINRRLLCAKNATKKK